MKSEVKVDFMLCIIFFFFDIENLNFEKIQTECTMNSTFYLSSRALFIIVLFINCILLNILNIML